MSELSEKLDDIKKEKDNETRLKRLKQVCRDSDRDILIDALEIAKHESTITLSGSILITALAAILITVLSVVLNNLVPDPTLRMVYVFIFLILYVVVLLRLIKFEFGRWTDLYYDLIDLRRERREEPDISKLDIIIAKVEAINPRIDVLEKNVSTKIEKEIMSIKRK